MVNATSVKFPLQAKENLHIMHVICARWSPSAGYFLKMSNLAAFPASQASIKWQDHAFREQAFFQTDGSGGGLSETYFVSLLDVRLVNSEKNWYLSAWQPSHLSPAPKMI